MERQLASKDKEATLYTATLLYTIGTHFHSLEQITRGEKSGKGPLDASTRGFVERKRLKC